jgi:Phosphoesterase family
MIKTLRQRGSSVKVAMDKRKLIDVVLFDRDGGKGIARRRDKIAVSRRMATFSIRGRLGTSEALLRTFATPVRASPPVTNHGSAVKANPTFWAETATFITFDEGGGHYDSGYVQPLDFFGDGTRIPMIVVSPHTKPGHIAHHYSDHVSILKFIERNWTLPAVSSRSRDNFPNPFTHPKNPYAPLNSPAISDLFELFDFAFFILMDTCFYQSP